MADQNDSTIESKKWYKNTKTIVTTVLLVSGAITTLITQWTTIKDTLFPPAEPALYNTAIVLEATSGMLVPFDEMTKFEAAKTAVKKKLSSWDITEASKLSMRAYGGGEDCFDLNAKKMAVLGFEQDNEQNVLSTLKELTPTGKGSLQDAIGAAIGDFSKPEFQGEGIKKSLIIIFGSLDPCSQDLTVEKIKARLEQESIDLNQIIGHDLRLIGLGLKQEDYEKIREFSASLGAEAFFPENIDQLILATGSAEQANELTGTQLYNNLEYVRAMPYLRKAAEGNRASAMRLLGNIHRGYAEGMILDLPGTKREESREIAIKWYKKSAKLGDQKSQNALQEMEETE